MGESHIFRKCWSLCMPFFVLTVFYGAKVPLIVRYSDFRNKNSMNSFVQNQHTLFFLQSLHLRLPTPKGGVEVLGPGAPAQ